MYIARLYGGVLHGDGGGGGAAEYNNASNVTPEPQLHTVQILQNTQLAERATFQNGHNSNNNNDQSNTNTRIIHKI